MQGSVAKAFEVLNRHEVVSRRNVAANGVLVRSFRPVPKNPLIQKLNPDTVIGGHVKDIITAVKENVTGEPNRELVGGNELIGGTRSPVAVVNVSKVSDHDRIAIQVAIIVKLPFPLQTFNLAALPAAASPNDRLRIGWGGAAVATAQVVGVTDMISQLKVVNRSTGVAAALGRSADIAMDGSVTAKLSPVGANSLKLVGTRGDTVGCLRPNRVVPVGVKGVIGKVKIAAAVGRNRLHHPISFS